MKNSRRSIRMTKCDAWFVTARSLFKSLCVSLFVSLCAFNTQTSSAATLKDEVANCKSKLENFASMPPTISCFAPNSVSITSLRGGPSRLLHFKLGENVDAVLHCEHVDEANKQFYTDSANSTEVLLTIHDRANGSTCFYDHVNTGGSTAPNVPSLDTANATSTGAADSFWSLGPNAGQCLDCHEASGPYLMGGSAHAMEVFGLVNNGHDMHDDKYSFVTVSDGVKKITTPTASNCGSSCHNFSPQPCDDCLGNMLVKMYQDFRDQGIMPPWNNSDYQWVNLDTPTNGSPSTGVEQERFVDAIASTSNKVVSELFSANNPNCPYPLPTGTSASYSPNFMEVHIADSDNSFLVSQPNRFGQLADRLSVFNVKDGLVCLNSDQDNGQLCQDYSIRYECTAPNGTKTWTLWYNMDGPSGDGDHEERSKDANVCTSPAGSVATGIQAQFTSAANGWTYSSYGPNDRLAQMSSYGLTCNNSDQPDGKCSNYVVRYAGCAVSQIQANKTLSNENTTGGLKQLTAASGSLAKGQAHNNSWNTQVWSIEPVTNTEYVRLHNVPNNLYLTVTSTADPATVGTAAFNTSTSEMWLVETVANSSYVRLKNLFSGKYLTMGDPNNFKSTPDYIPIYSQGRNTGWNTQRWLIQ